MDLLGKKASFMPTCMTEKTGGALNEFAKPVTGIITMVHRAHGYFIVTYRAGETIQREGFKFCDIDEAVKVHG